MKPNKYEGVNMHFIGITGGVGAGKSCILEYLAQKEGCKVMLADEIAHELMEPGTACFSEIQKTFSGEDIFDETGAFDRVKLAKVLFSSDEKREKLNQIVHPAVKQYVIDADKAARADASITLLVLEAALLIEEHYNEICEELWYIYTSEEIREQRLMASRGYSKEKVHQIFASQLSEEVYRKHCKVVIDNNGDVSETYRQIEEALAGLK